MMQMLRRSISLSGGMPRTPLPVHPAASVVYRSTRHGNMVSQAADSQAALAVGEEGGKPRSPSVPLFKGQTVDAATELSLEHLSNTKTVSFIINHGAQAITALSVLQRLAESQTSAHLAPEMRVFSLRQKPSGEQEPPAVTKGFSFRHVIRCQMVEARSSTTENVLKVKGSDEAKEKLHYNLARKALTILKTEADKPSTEPTVSLIALGAKSNLHALKALIALRPMLYSMQRVMVIQVNPHKITRDDGQEVNGLRYNVFMDVLPERPTGDGSQNSVPSNGTQESASAEQQ